MAIARTAFACTSCGGESLRWEGRCPACGEWNTLVEVPGAASGRPRPGGGPGAGAETPAPLAEPGVAGGRGPGTRRRLGFGDLDRVLGGGLVPGSLLLLGGPPGIGKSTLLLHAAAALRRGGGVPLYVSGEESREQVALRAARLGGGASGTLFLSATDADEVAAAAERAAPDLLCVDSIQTLATGRLPSAPGSLAQVRECAALLHRLAKRTGTAVCLVGHVTKGGVLAGPRTLEHLVDVVLHFEGQRSVAGRLLRATKNRYGSVDEIAAFRMTERGLDPVPDPTALFLGERPSGESGSALAVSLQGTRPLAVEVQALTARSRFAAPQRVCTGFPGRRLAVLLAVLERRAGLALGERDAFVNVTGGLRLADPAADLAIAAALVSAERDRPTPAGLAFIGEVGLGGEVRGVSAPEERLRAAERAGLRGAVLPAAAAAELAGPGEVRGISHVREIEALLATGAAR